MMNANKSPMVFLAPMAGVTDGICRRFCFEQGCDYATTEMISAQGYMTAPKDSHAYAYMLKVFPGEGRVFCQLFGREPEWFVRAVEKLQESGTFCGFDINMGCPAHKVTGGGNGSALMLKPSLAGAIMESCVKASHLPVTLKIRLGWDEDHLNAAEIVHIAEESGIAWVTVHGRTRRQFYADSADWDAVGAIKSISRIPIIVNGDIDSGESAKKALEVTHCDGIAIGRAALGNPWIFKEIKCALQGEEYHRPSLSEVLCVAREHAVFLSEERGEHRALLEMRKHFGWYISGVRGAAKIRTRINEAGSFEEVFDLLNHLETENMGIPTEG